MTFDTPKKVTDVLGMCLTVNHVRHIETVGKLSINGRDQISDLLRVLTAYLSAMASAEILCL